MEGLTEVALADWLLGTWRDRGPTVCLIEGFSGIGKSSLARSIARAWDGPSVYVSGAGTGLDELLLNAAAQLEQQGNKIMSDQPDLDFRRGLMDLLAGPSLVVIDDFEALLESSTRELDQEFGKFLQEVGRGALVGRVLLVSGESPRLGPWAQDLIIKTMAPPPEDSATTMLRTLLSDRGLLDEVPASSIPDVVLWLGRNPRAMQAFVACLRDEPLENIIEADRDAWDLRDQNASNELVRRLEEGFLDKTISRLEPGALLLLDGLAVYRRPFTVEAIAAASPQGVDSATGKDALASRFLLARDRKWYTVHPVARQLSIATLRADPKRFGSANLRAGDFFRRRIDGRGERALIRSGSAFVEARFHLLAADRESDVQQLVGDFRRVLLRNYSYLHRPPEDPVEARQLLITLMSALSDLSEGYPRLRAVLAQLLVRRGMPGDGILALRHATIASRESEDPSLWILRAELTARHDTPLAVRAVSDQAVARLPGSIAVRVCVRVAELLTESDAEDEALAALTEAAKSLEVSESRRLYTCMAFVLVKLGRAREAIRVLADTYERIGVVDAQRYRLFEQALFIAFQLRARDDIVRLKELIVNDGLNDKQPALCEILLLQLDGLYREAAEHAAKFPGYPALAAQGAFCWLSVGNVRAAGDALAAETFVPNPANWWLRALIALCSDSPEVYSRCMTEVLGRPLTLEEAQDQLLWLRTWESSPQRLRIHPAFYFPVLPASLTRLESDLSYAEQRFNLGVPEDVEAIRLPLEPLFQEASQAIFAEELSVAARVVDSEDMRININLQGAGGMGDTYNVFGQAGAVGKDSRARDMTFEQNSIGALDMGVQVREELAAVIASLGGDEVGSRSREVEALRAAIAAAESDDDEGFVAHLRRAGNWALEKAGGIGAGLAAAAIARALGLSG